MFVSQYLRAHRTAPLSRTRARAAMTFAVTAFSPTLLYYWIAAFSVWEALSIYFILNVFPHATVQEYYRRIPSWVTIGGDFLYSTLIFLTALALYARVRRRAPERFAHPAWFVALFVATQWVYDLTFAAIVLRLPKLTRYVDYFQRYIGEVGFGAAFSDSVYLVGWLLVTWLLLKYASLPLATFVLVFMLFVWIVWAY